MEDTGALIEEGGRKDRKRTITTESGSRRSKQKIDGSEELLPGIPDDITTKVIATKLPWTTFHILSHVSHGWRRAIQSHKIYDARVLNNSTQTLVALDHRTPNGDTRMALYSVSDNSCYHLPPIPGLQKIPGGCECVYLDGKLYLLGASDSNVYVFDLAGQRQWKQCASMANERAQFGCCVKDGKIYVFGGTPESGPEPRGCLSEVYEPKEDVWSPITPMPSFRTDHKVTVVGEELFVHSGFLYDLDIPDPDDNAFHYATSADVYHSLQDSWRTLERFTQSSRGTVCMVKGKFHRLKRGDTIQECDIHTNSWGPKEPLSFGESEPTHYIAVMYAAVGLDDEILAIVECEDEEDGNDGGVSLVKTQGLSGEDTEVVFQKLQCPLDLSYPFSSHLLCLIEL